jgi:hypothetical protein
MKSATSALTMVSEHMARLGRLSIELKLDRSEFFAVCDFLQTKVPRRKNVNQPRAQHIAHLKGTHRTCGGPCACIDLERAPPNLH